jgi:hypothetical protein
MIKFNQNNLDAEMVIGDTGAFSFNVKVNGESALKSGDTVYFTVRKLIDNSIVIQKTITDFPDGICNILINPTDTSNLTTDDDNYIYDLKLVRSTGEVDSLIPNRPFAYFSLKRGVK